MSERKIVVRIKNDSIKNIPNNDAYGTFYSTGKQIIDINNNIIFENQINNCNLELIEDNTSIKIFKSGQYIIHISCYLNNNGFLGVCINDKLDVNTITQSNMDNIIIINQKMDLKEGNILSFKNCGDNVITTNISDFIIKNELHNIHLIIFKISDIYNLPPKNNILTI